MTSIDELTVLLTQYDARETSRAAEATEQQTRKASQLGAFSEVVQTVIRPMMVEIGEQLGTHGHAYAVHEQESRITLEVLPSRLPADQYQSGSRPWLSFVQVVPQQQVTLLRSMIMPGRAGGNGSVGTYALDEITPTFVRGAIIEWLTLILR